MQPTDVYYSLVQTARELLREEGNSADAGILIPENVDFDLRNHDNWNGGIDSYEVVVNVPVSKFAQLKKNNQVEEAAKAISEALEASNAGDESTIILGVVLRPSSTAIKPQEESHNVISTSFWTPGHFKVFISHLSSEKDRAARLKAALTDYGMSCFVAHEDIAVTAAWHEEIVKALKTMDCLIAVLSDGFNASQWCDQEVGFGLGRDVLCIPIKGNIDPYGLLGKYQAMKASGRPMKEVAESIFKIVSTHENTMAVYQKTISDLFLTSRTKDIAQKRLAILNKIPALDKDVASGIRLHFAETVLKNDKDAISIINELLHKSGLEELPTRKQQDSLYSEDLPF